MTRFDSLDAVLDGIEASAAAGFESLKIDTVVMRGVNDHELTAIIEYGRPLGAEVRFIEYMDVGGATRWSPGAVVSRRDMLDALEKSLRPDHRRSTNSRLRRPIGSRYPMARSSASSPRRPSRSAAAAIAAG